MAAPLVFLKQPNVLILCTYIWLTTLAVTNETVLFKTLSSDTKKGTTNQADPIQMAALGRPLSLGMLYDCRKDSFIPGVTLWDENILSRDLEFFPQPHTSLRFSSSDSLTSKLNMLDVSASLKASFMGGLVEVGGSAKYLKHSKSSNQQSRVTMFYSETTKYKQLTMSQLAKFKYPDVFDKKSATHVVTAVLYGAQAFMVFDKTFSEEDDKQTIDGKLNVMVKKIPGFSIEGEGAVKMTDVEKKHADDISCTFHGDFHLEQNPTTYMEAIQTYSTLPKQLKDNPENAVPITVWLYPLHLLDNDTARLERQIRTELVSSIAHVIESLNEAERTCNDLLERQLVNALSDIRERLTSFQRSLLTYKTVLLEKLRGVLPAIRGGEMEEKKLEDILKMHRSSPFNAEQLSQWLDEAKQEHSILKTHIKPLDGIKIKESFTDLLFNSDVDAVVCLMFTSLRYEDPYLSTLEDFLKSDMFKDLEGPLFSVKPVSKWYKQSNVVMNMRANSNQFRWFSEANKGETRINFIISATSHSSIAGSSIYLYQKGILTDTKFKPSSQPAPLEVRSVRPESVIVKLQRTSFTDRYRVEYKKKEDSGFGRQWLSKHSTEEFVSLTGLESGKQYLIRYRIADRVGWSEPSDAVTTSSVEPVIVGGMGGDEFTFKSATYNRFKKIIITYSQEFYMELIQMSYGRVISLNTIQVLFQDDQMIKVGSVEGRLRKEFSFEITDTVVSATLWPNRRRDRFGGLEFVILRKGERQTMSLKCDEVGEPVTVNTKSGLGYGVAGRSGYELDALGFYFS